MSIVISVRIKREISQILEEAGINISNEVKKFLENLAWKIKIKRNLDLMDEILKDMPPPLKDSRLNL